jgi:hypothetical protein
MSKDSYWFRHDSTAGRGLKIRKIAHIYGHWGKGVYWDVVEMLRDSENYEYDNSEFDLTMLADLIGCKDSSKFVNWYNDCIKFELLKENKGKFFSPALKEAMIRWESSKSNGSKGGRPKKEKPKNNPTETQSKPSTKPNENHNRIGYNSIEENRIEEKIKEQNYKPNFQELLSKIKTRIHQDWIMEVYQVRKKQKAGAEKTVQEFMDNTMKMSLYEFCKSSEVYGIKFYNESAAIKYWKLSSKGYISDIDVWRKKLKAITKRAEAKIADINS